MKIIILAGGSGTRLWPISKEKLPKQFTKLHGENNSLFQETFLRSLTIAKEEDIYVVTIEKYKFLVMNAIGELNCMYRESNILIEPEAKNTLPAIYAGVKEIEKKGKDTIVVFPSDHIISKSEEFAKIIKETEKLTLDSIITFGIIPSSPKTGYGYISPGNVKSNGYTVNSFKEKPNLEKAQEYIDQGYYWNAGIFMFNSELFTEEVKLYCPEIYYAFETNDNIFTAFSKINSKISIDYGIMEKSNRIVVVPVDIGWDDLGCFDSFFDVFEKDENGIITDNQNIIIDSKNSIVLSNYGRLIATIGIEDLIIIDDRDALLVCKKNQSQKVKNVVDVLTERDNSSFHNDDKFITYWGHYRKLDEVKDQFDVRKVTIFKGKSFGYHVRELNKEQWIVVNGIARTTFMQEQSIIRSGQLIIFREGIECFLENIGETQLEIIVVRNGPIPLGNENVWFNDKNDKH